MNGVDWKKILEAYPDSDIPVLLQIAWKLQQQEEQRAENLERKGFSLLGFVGVIVALLGGSVETFRQMPIWWRIALGVGVLLTLASAVCGFMVIRSRHYMFPDERSILQSENAVEAQRSHVADTLKSTIHNIELTNDRGGWLKTGEGLFVVGIGVLSLVLIWSAFLCPHVS